MLQVPVARAQWALWIPGRTLGQATGVHMRIRQEVRSDIPLIARVTERAFAEHLHSSGTEAAIIRNLRASGCLTVSLVAEMGGLVCGHIAASPVQVDGRDVNWFGLGPVAVEPTTQGMGLGKALIHECLAKLEALGAAGCVVLGDPNFYSRFGFKPNAGLIYPGAPAAHFMALAYGSEVPEGVVNYHASFNG